MSSDFISFGLVSKDVNVQNDYSKSWRCLKITTYYWPVVLVLLIQLQTFLMKFYLPTGM